MAEQLYAIMQDSSRPFDKTVLARKAPSHITSRFDFWTDRASPHVWFLPYERAVQVRSDYVWNNARIVKKEKALATLERQKGSTQ